MYRDITRGEGVYHPSEASSWLAGTRRHLANDARNVGSHTRCVEDVPRWSAQMDIVLLVFWALLYMACAAALIAREVAQYSSGARCNKFRFRYPRAFLVFYTTTRDSAGCERASEPPPPG